MRRAVIALLILPLAESDAFAQGELVCSETRHFESIHSDLVWTFQALEGERYSFESERLTEPYSIELEIFRGGPLASAEVVDSYEPVRICDWEAPETGSYLLIQVHTGGTFAVTMHCGDVPQGCANPTPVADARWAEIKALFR